jgi:hypothetical protein
MSFEAEERVCIPEGDGYEVGRSRCEDRGGRALFDHESSPSPRTGYIGVHSQPGFKCWKEELLDSSER